jgi:hypothetical protein
MGVANRYMYKLTAFLLSVQQLLTSSLSSGISELEIVFLVCFVVQPSVCEACRFHNSSF